jgi:hypothetical protein
VKFAHTLFSHFNCDARSNFVQAKVVDRAEWIISSNNLASCGESLVLATAEADLRTERSSALLCLRCLQHRRSLRRAKASALLGPAPRRSALRENRRLARPEKTVKLNHAVLLTGYARHNMKYWEIIANNLKQSWLELRLHLSDCFQRASNLDC